MLDPAKFYAVYYDAKFPFLNLLFMEYDQPDETIGAKVAGDILETFDNRVSGHLVTLTNAEERTLFVFKVPYNYGDKQPVKIDSVDGLRGYIG